MARRVPVTAESLAGVELFKDLSPAQREDIAAHCHGRICDPEELLVSRNSVTTDVFFIVSGRVSVTLYSSAGKETKLRDLGPGQMAGELAAIDGAPRSADIVALEETLIVAMPAVYFQSLLRQYPEVVDGTLKGLVKLVRALSERVFEFSTLTVNNRIHAELLRLAQGHLQADGSALIKPMPTHADIAARISTHREAVSRELSELTRRGVLERISGGLRIKNVGALQNLVVEGYDRALP
jgi:CRP-like cAMP-binding protein